MKKQLALISLVAAMWFAVGTTGLCQWLSRDPCSTTWTETDCLSSASVEINSINVPHCVCVGTEVCATAVSTNIEGQIKYTQKWSPTSTNCPDVLSTNATSPMVVSNWWTISGPGSYSKNGEGLGPACFTPTNTGTATITFNSKYTNEPPCTGMGTATKTQTVTVGTTPVVATGTLDFMDPEIGSPNGTIWEPIVATVKITAKLEYCGGETATIEFSGITIKPNTPVPCATMGEIPLTRTVGLSGTDTVGTINFPTSEMQGPRGYPAGDYGMWTGWGRWFVYTWNIDKTNCSATITMTQPRVW